MGDGFCYSSCDIHQKYKFSKRFVTSAEIEESQAYEVNRRVVLTTGNIRIGHQVLVKFAAVINVLTPMNENSCCHQAATSCNSGEAVAKVSLQNAVEAKEFYEPGEDVVFDTGVCGDGTWRRQGYSSSFEVVISTITGKEVDVEIMSKEWKECWVWKDKELLSFIRGGRDISIVTKWTILGIRGQWMHQQK